MSKDILLSTDLSKALIEEGLVPDECTDIKFDIGVDTPLTLTYTVFVTGDRLVAFMRAMQKAAEKLDA